MLPKKKSRFDLLGVLDEIAEEPEAALGPKPPAPPTERLRVQLGNAWEVFLKEIKTGFPDHFLFKDGREDPTEPRLKAFFHWYAASYTRNVKDPPGVESLEQFVFVFRMANNARSEYRITSEVMNRIKLTKENGEHGRCGDSSSAYVD
ncbi:hypothetical protein ACEPPN_006109 [Leptodophora sp. 'Broadleaf-Isolate-01']